MLELKDIHSGYNGNSVLKGISMTIPKNEIVAIIGPNGAGKSTVIKSIFNLAQVTSGSIHFNAKNITGLKTHELMKEGIGYVTQGRINFSNLTIEENLRIGADHIHHESVVKAKLESGYALFPISKERRKSLAYGLSGGQQQMLALGRALMQNPKLILLDEPSLGLSPLLQKELFQIIAQLKKDGITIVIVEQNAKKAIEIADHTYLLEDGKIAIHGGKDILTHPHIKDVYLGGRY